MTTTPENPVEAADLLADNGGRLVRRTVNEAIYDEAVQRRLAPDTPLQFVCECGSLACGGTVELRLSQFDPAGGPIVAHP
jgi:hypothetical protein